MNILLVLIPASLLLGLLALVGFLWMLRRNQFDDPEGNAARILSGRYDDHPATEDQGRPRGTRNSLDDPGTGS